MKTLLMSITLLTSIQVSANTPTMEFDSSTELKCHEEIKKMGCVSSAGNENIDCVESKKASLTSICQELHSARMSNQ